MRRKCKDNDNLTKYRKITVKNMSKWQNRATVPLHDAAPAIGISCPA